jgi:small subunit ribosomal protein S1
MQKVEGLKEGQLIEGTITHLTKFGAFARLGEDLEGLIHVSELSEQRVAHPKEVVKEGDVVTLRVIKIEPERRRIGLSLRKVDSPAYADLDWKMALSSEVGEVKSNPAEAIQEALVVDESPETPEMPVVDEGPKALETPVVEESPEMPETQDTAE